METSGLLMGPMSLKDVWKSASMERGALCVMTFGAAKMPVLLVDNWDSVQWVCIYICITLEFDQN